MAGTRVCAFAGAGGVVDVDRAARRVAGLDRNNVETDFGFKFNLVNEIERIRCAGSAGGDGSGGVGGGGGGCGGGGVGGGAFGAIRRDAFVVRLVRALLLDDDKRPRMCRSVKLVVCGATRRAAD